MSIDLAIKSQQGETELSVKCQGELSDKCVSELISALDAALQRARKAAKERGHYNYLAAVEKEGADEDGWPPSWKK